jgi:hypothetical protein
MTKRQMSALTLVFLDLASWAMAPRRVTYTSDLLRPSSPLILAPERPIRSSPIAEISRRTKLRTLATFPGHSALQCEAHLLTRRGNRNFLRDLYTHFTLT